MPDFRSGICERETVWGFCELFFCSRRLGWFGVGLRVSLISWLSVRKIKDWLSGMASSKMREWMVLPEKSLSTKFVLELRKERWRSELGIWKNE